MILTQHTQYIEFKQGESVFSFLPSGDVFEFSFGNLLINQFLGSAAEGSANNIWLRVYAGGKIIAHPLLGIRSGSAVSKSPDRLIHSGAFMNISYTVSFCAAAPGLWFWNVELEGNGETVDLLYGQDIGVAAKNGVLTNELYMAQYLGHRIFETPHGYVICSRQNQDQGGVFPYLQQGMIKGAAVGYATDGIQFFGLSYRASNEPRALLGNLPNQNQQGEFSYTALQSEKLILREKRSLAFYGLFRPDHKDAVHELEFSCFIQSAFDTAFNAPGNSIPAEAEPQPERIPPVRIRKEFGAPYASPPWDTSAVNRFFPSRKLEEWENGAAKPDLLSFFTPQHVHVVLQQKELLAERPHGTIITTLVNGEGVDNNLVTSTAYMYGLFNGQIAAGNTSFHKFINTARGQFNILKNNGQRIYVKIDGTYRLLTLPAAFEMGMNYARWYYTLEGDTLVVTSFAAAESMDIVLELRSLSGKPMDCLITHQLVLGEHEFQHPVQMEALGEGTRGGTILRFSPDKTIWADNPYPGLHFDVQLPGLAFTYDDDRIFFEDHISRNGTLLTLSVMGKTHFQIIIQGRQEAEAAKPLGEYSFEKELAKYFSFYQKITGGFHLEPGKDGEGKNETEKLNETVWWYSHNALVHFAVPHGLEQSGGAAWGTRDLCQGPMEYFLALGHFSLARSCLVKLFSHQFAETHEWPQWFMFDRYPINAGDCHGDVIFWPLKSAGDYIATSGDESILYETLPYSSKNKGRPDPEKEPVLSHIKKAIENIESRFVHGTALVSYAGGDWDDTLQPAAEGMKEKMVSAWTQALGIQVLRQLGTVLRPIDAEYARHLLETAALMEEAFEKLLIKNGTIAGFLCFEDGSIGNASIEDASLRYLLHPEDAVTGIHYRLLPLTRSIIAGIVDREQAGRNMRIIDEQLKYPDGVRLMDRPAPYDGGVSRLFRRAEQAANVGREIGLQYTHAHIRYLEALAKLGLHETLWDALFRINPINIAEKVPNALPRQSNLYFSSSDGDFMDRYEFSKNFSLLREGRVPVKGGWRIYSSGPGIYLHQLISGVLGIRFTREGLVIDPVLPLAMDGLRFTFTCYGRETVFVYRIKESASPLSARDTSGISITRNGKPLPGEAIPNRYRAGGMLIKKEDLLKERGEIVVTVEPSFPERD
ncbi:hypothetical protein FACS189485_04680 [Spirochaetia bacterium]|nr:hypothetical protein FACS189485_04680 [Spirochaetia bacterium]